MAKIVKSILRKSLIALGAVIALISSLILVLHIPSVQLFVISKVQSSLLERSGHELRIAEVDIRWFDVGVFRGVELLDYMGQPMLTAEQLVVNFDLISLYDNRTLHADGVLLESANLNLIDYPDSLDTNLKVFLNSLRKENSEGLGLELGEVALQGLSIHHDDQVEGTQNEWFVEQLLALEISSYGGKWKGSIASLRASDRLNGINLDDLQVSVLFETDSLSLMGLSLRSGNSSVSSHINVGFDQFSQLLELDSGLWIDIDVKELHVDPEDIAFFSVPLAAPLDFHGEIVGSPRSLQLTGIEVESLSSFVRFDAVASILMGSIEGNIEEAFISENLVYEYTNFESPAKNVSLSGLFFLSDSIASYSGLIDSDIGRASGSVELVNYLEPRLTYYDVDMRVGDLQMNKILSRNDIGSVSGAIKLLGRGTQIETADLSYQFDLNNVEINGQSYDSFRSTGTLNRQVAKLKLEVEDDALVLNGKGQFKASDLYSLELDLILHKADLAKMNLLEEQLIISSYLSVDLSGKDEDHFTGRVLLNDIEAQNEFGFAELSDVSITLDSVYSKRLEVVSQDFEVSAKGDFPVAEVIGDFSSAVANYIDRLQVNDENQSFEVEDKSYELEVDASFYDLKKYFDLLGKQWELSSDASLLFKFVNDSSELVQFEFAADTIILGNRTLHNNSFDLLTKRLSGDSIVADLLVSSLRQTWDLIPETSEFRTKAQWRGGDLDFNFHARQDRNSSEVDLFAKASIDSSTIEVKVLPSEFIAFDKAWQFNEDNLIVISPEKTEFEEFELYDQHQAVGISGVINAQAHSLLDIYFKNFELINLSAILPKKFEGQMQASGTFSRPSNQGPWSFESNLDIASLNFEDLLVGDLYGDVNWSKYEGGLAVDLTISRDMIKTGTVRGIMDALSEDDQLDLIVDFNRMNIDWVEPLFSNSVSGVSGSASGRIEVDGMIRNPQFHGRAYLSKGNLTLDYLNTKYSFDGYTTFDRNNIAFDSVRILDRFGSEARLTGSITHQQFKGQYSDIRIGFNQFELLNTNRQNNSVYYGNAFGTGAVSITGPFDNILIEANGTTDPNTNIHVPLEDETSVLQEEYITFVNLTDTTTSIVKSEEVPRRKVRGVRVDMNVNVTRDAYIEMIFDPKTGDIIRGRGTGNLQMNVNNSGDFELFGQVQIQEGAYNWTTAILNKEFKIRPGGTVSFYGDPYAGILNLDAYYRQLADPTDWSPDLSIDGGTGQKSPVLVLLGLNGPMTQPNITFKLELDENTATSSTVDSIWRDLLASVNGNEEELKRQVFSLLVLRKFSPRSNTAVGGQIGQGFENSVSEFMSNQLSYWLNQVDENLEISIDLTGLDQEAFETFQLRLAYTFMEGRLRVSGASAINNPQQQSTTVSNILGDWSVDYVLTEDGRLRIKVFSQTNQFSYASDQNLEAGMSLQFVRSFDEFRELLGKSRKQGMKEKNKKSGTETVSTN